MFYILGGLVGAVIASVIIIAFELSNIHDDMQTLIKLKMLDQMEKDGF